MDAIGIEVNRADAAIQRRIVILASRGDFDQLGFHVLGDDANLFAVELLARIASQSRGGSDHQRGRAGNTRSGRRLRVCLDFKASVGRKEAHQMRRQWMLELARGTELAKVAKLFFYFGVNRLQADFVVGEPSDFAARKDIDSEIYSDCAGMKKIKRPKIQSAAGQVHPAGRVRNDRSGRRQILFRIKLGHLAELVVTAVEELLHRLVFQLVKML